MDRKSIKRVAGYLCIWIIFAGLISVVLYGVLKKDYQDNLEKMVWLMKKHPEVEPELVKVYEGELKDREREEVSGEELLAFQEKIEGKYGYSVWKNGEGKMLLVFWKWTVLLSLAGFVGIFLSECRRSRKDTEKKQWEEQAAGRWIEKYLKGEYDYQETEEILPFSVEERLRELGEYLEQCKEQFRTEEENTKALITNISHQLKTPLASLKMSQELLESGELSSGEREEFLQHNRQEIEKLDSLTEEMIHLSRLENHMIQLDPRAVGLKETLTGAVNTVYMKAFAKGMNISLSMEEDICVCHDRKWTQEAFVNVLDNAVKYAPGHTEIEILARRMTSYILIEIKDQGPGIPAEEYHRIFRRFYRGKEAEEAAEGAGVGLYLARNILEQQGGIIRVRSRPGQGSCFQMTLPLEENRNR